MSYVEKILVPGEALIYRGQKTWMMVWSGVALGFLSGGSFLYFSGSPSSMEAMAVHRAGGCLMVMGLLVLLKRWVQRLAIEIAVTDRRVIFKRGWLWRRTIEMNIGKIESVDVQQSIFGRLFNYGTIVLVGTGGSLEPITDITRPLAFRNALVSAGND